MCKSCYMIINIICKCNLAKSATFSVGFKLKNIMFQKVLHSRCNDRLQTKATQFGCRRYGKVEPSFWILKSHFLVHIHSALYSSFPFQPIQPNQHSCYPIEEIWGKRRSRRRIGKVTNLESFILYIVSCCRRIGKVANLVWYKMYLI